MSGNNPISKLTADVFSRFDWNAIPPKRVEPMSLPVNRVVSLWADVDPCSTTEECKQRVRQLQKRQMEEKNLTDIQHHFMVGGDGNVYEGRGWYNKGPPYSPHLPFAKELSGNSIEIAFLGRPGTKPSETLQKGASDCVALGLLAKHLQEKLLFFYKTSDNIDYLSHYETNAPGQSNTTHFSDIDVSKYEKSRKEDTFSEHINAGMKSSKTQKQTNKDTESTEHINANFKSSKINPEKQ